MSEVVNDHVWRPDGTVVLRSGFDPASDRVVGGYRRFYLGVDLGQTDPSAFVVVQDERLPHWRRHRQELGLRQRTVVWCDFLKDTSYSAIADYIVAIMAKPPLRGRTKFAFDSTGSGKPFGSMLKERQIPFTAVTITAGNAITKRGNEHHVAKNELLGRFANGLETQDLRIAHDLPLRERLEREIAAFETKTTNAGNVVLDASRSSETGHADLAVAAAIAFYLSNNVAGLTGEAPVAGYWG